jgi:exonuclease SbcC
MIRTIILENFMAHARTELELGPGITALTGANNTGKSAIVEALRCVATNPAPNHCIRHGAKEARVTLEMDDGAKVVWIRKKRSAGYEITLPGKSAPEEPFWKLQGKVPDEVRALLRLDLVELETGEPIDVHVGNQREPVFLLNRPDSNVAAFFAASTESAHLLAMQNALKGRTTEAKRRERELEAKSRRIEAELDTLAALPDITLRMDEALQLEATAKQLQAAVPLLEQRMAALRRTEGARNALGRSATILKALGSVPKLSPVGGLRTLATDMDRTAEHLAAAGRTRATLALLAAPPPSEDTGRLAELCERLQKTAAGLRKAEVRNRAMAGLLAPEAMENAAHLAALVDEMIAARYRLKRVARRETVLRTVAESPRLEQDARLGSMLADLRRLTGLRQAAEGELAGLETRLQTLKDTLAARLAELGGCPTCGARIDADSFLDRGHVHGR